MILTLWRDGSHSIQPELLTFMDLDLAVAYGLTDMFEFINGAFIRIWRLEESCDE